jgi:hypothetical protein
VRIYGDVAPVSRLLDCPDPAIALHRIETVIVADLVCIGYVSSEFLDLVSCALPVCGFAAVYDRIVACVSRVYGGRLGGCDSLFLFLFSAYGWAVSDLKREGIDRMFRSPGYGFIPVPYPVPAMDLVGVGCVLAAMCVGYVGLPTE